MMAGWTAAISTSESAVARPKKSPKTIEFLKRFEFELFLPAHLILITLDIPIPGRFLLYIMYKQILALNKEDLNYHPYRTVRLY
jgi:hypothetical protein